MNENELIGGRFGWGQQNPLYQANCQCIPLYASGRVGFAVTRCKCDTCANPIQSIYKQRWSPYIHHNPAYACNFRCTPRCARCVSQ